MSTITDPDGTDTTPSGKIMAAMLRLEAAVVEREADRAWNYVGAAAAAVFEAERQLWQAIIELDESDDTKILAVMPS